MEPRRSRMASLILMAWLVTACSTGAPSPAAAGAASPPAAAPTPVPTASPQPTPSATAAPTPEPTPDLEAAKSGYLAVAEALTAAAQGPLDSIAAGGSYTPAEWGAFHDEIADAYEEAIRGLDAIEFPDTVADRIAEMRALFVDLQALFASVADDPSLDVWDEFIEKAGAYGAIADEVRETLGLPPRPTPSS